MEKKNNKEAEFPLFDEDKTVVDMSPDIPEYRAFVKLSGNKDFQTFRKFMDKYIRETAVSLVASQYPNGAEQEARALHVQQGQHHLWRKICRWFDTAEQMIANYDKSKNHDREQTEDN